MARESLKKLASWKEMAGVAFICFFIVIYFFKSVYSKKAEATRALKTKIGEMNTEKNSLNEFLSAISKEEGSDALESLKRSPDLKMQLLTGEKKPAFSSIAPFFAMVSAPSFREGVIIDSLNHQLPKVEGGVESTSYNVKIHGPYPYTSAFMKRILNLEALLSIESLTVTLYQNPDKKEKTEEFAVEMDLKGALYKPVPGGGEQPPPAETTAATTSH